MVVIKRRGEKLLEKIRGNEEFVKFVSTIEDDLNYIDNVINSAKSWDELYNLLHSISFGRAPIYKGDNIKLKDEVTSYRNDVLKKQVEQLKKCIYSNTSKILSDQSYAYTYIYYLYELLENFSNEYEKLKKQKNYIDFNDIEHLSLKLLVTKNEDGNIEYTDIAKNLQEKFNEVYTDEYQDISFIQEEILNSVSKDNNRFMVGDIKQSIYKFRQAMPDIFNKKYNEYLNVENLEENEINSKIILSKNFRSRKEVLFSINYIFEQIMSNELGDCNYCDLETLKYGAQAYDNEESLNYKTEINIIENKIDFDNLDEKDETIEYIEDLKKFEIESIFIANKINEIMSKYKTYNTKNGKSQNVKYKDIVILLRSIKDKGSILEDTLRKYNIPAFCDASTSLFESEEVYLLLSFLKVIDNPYQDIYMTSVMYSIIGKFNLDELVYIRNIDRHSRLYDNIIKIKDLLEKSKNKNEFENNVYLKIVEFIKILNDFREYSNSHLVSDLIIRIYDKTNMYRQYILDNNSSQRRANLDLLINLAQKCEAQNIVTLSEYIAYVRNLKDRTDSSASSAKIIGENEDVVRIMTIHKSKGLEFPYVILCDTMKKYNMFDTSATVTMHHELGLGLNIVNKDYKITYPSLIKQAIKERIINETKSEELRMLYVALTRAKEKLFIYASVKDYEKFSTSKTIIYDENKKIIPSVVKSNNNYFENIYISLKKDDFKDYFDINILDALKDIDVDISNVKENKREFLSNFLSSNDFKLEEIEEEILKIKEDLEYKYGFEEYTALPSRISVSELKSNDNIKYVESVSINKLKAENIEKKYRRPNTFDMQKEEIYTPSRKGTLIHFILENLEMNVEYSYEKLKNYINTLVDKEIISKQDRKYINNGKILNFLNSKLGIQIRNSDYISKEQEFILSDESISKSLIQGIIDLYYINDNGNIVLIDFKTDKIDKEEIFIEKYKKQLEIYKAALEKILDKKVESTYIYSFYLDREIKL